MVSMRLRIYSHIAKILNSQQGPTGVFPFPRDGPLSPPLPVAASAMLIGKHLYFLKMP